MSGGALSVLLVAFALLAAARVVALLVRDATPKVERRALMTPAELRFFRQLAATLPHRWVFPQVAIGALLNARGGQDQRAFRAARNAFSQKIVDFAVADPADGRVLYIVELDDRSHETRREADARRDAMLNVARYDVVRIPTKPWPSGRIIAERLAAVEDGEVTGLPTSTRRR